MIGVGHDASTTFRNRCRFETAKTQRTQRPTQRKTQNDSFATSLRSLRLCVFKVESSSSTEAEGLVSYELSARSEDRGRRAIDSDSDPDSDSDGPPGSGSERETSAETGRLSAGAEYRGADADHGCALGDSDFEIVAHSHGKLGKGVT